MRVWSRKFTEPTLALPLWRCIGKRARSRGGRRGTGQGSGRLVHQLSSTDCGMKRKHGKKTTKEGEAEANLCQQRNPNRVDVDQLWDGRRLKARKYSSISNGARTSRGRCQLAFSLPPDQAASPSHREPAICHYILFANTHTNTKRHSTFVPIFIKSLTNKELSGLHLYLLT